MATKVDVKIKCILCDNQHKMTVTPGFDEQYVDDCFIEDGWVSTQDGWICPDCYDVLVNGEN